MKMSFHLHVPAALPQENGPQYPSNKKLCGPRADLDIVQQRKISFSCQDSNPGRPTPSRSLYQLFFYYYLVCEAIVPASGDSEDDCGEADGM
jgi:hypothetical protein